MSAFLPTIERLNAPEFVAVDFETANEQGGVSACQVALTLVKNGEPVQEFATYLRPPEGYREFEFTWLHGITWQDVADAPEWPEVAGQIREFVRDRPTWAHYAPFDHGVWSELDEYFGVSSMPQEFYCTVFVSRKTAPDLPNHKLPTVVKHYRRDFVLQHHWADSDAQACAAIVAGLQKDPASADVLRNSESD